MQCSSCGSRDIDFNESAGHAVCVVCGTVLEENTIVSSIEFQEAGDRSQIVGQFVSGNCSQPFSAAPRGRGRYGFSRDSRDATLANARRTISQVVSSLRLPTHYVDKAIRLYSLALQRSFLYGRRQVHVVAAVIYTVARQESSPHLLIDFSDMLQVNVYILGQCFLQLTRLLSLRLQIVDPCLYIHRFAARLELGTANVGAIAVTALRAMTRMKRDWMSTGRRPDGLCAAALLIAARAHGFDRGIQDMATLFRISVNTIARRLQEFRLTPSAQLTVSQFHQPQRPDAASMPEFDPPSFVQNVLDESLQIQMAAAAGGVGLGDSMGAGEVVVPITVASTETGTAVTSSTHLNEYDDAYRHNEEEDGAMTLKLSSRPKAFSYAKASRNLDRRRLYHDIYTEIRAPLEAAAEAAEAAVLVPTLADGSGGSEFSGRAAEALYLDAGLEAELGAIQAQAQSQNDAEAAAAGDVASSAMRSELISKRLQALSSEAEDVARSVLFGQNRTFTVQLPSYASDQETPALMRLRAGLMKRHRSNRLGLYNSAGGGNTLSENSGVSGVVSVHEAAAAALRSSYRHLRDGSESHPEPDPAAATLAATTEEPEDVDETDGAEDGEGEPLKRRRLEKAFPGEATSSAQDPLSTAASQDPEVAALILGHEESLKRKQIWERMHGAFIAERDARAAQRERDAIKKTGGSGRKSTGDPTSGSNVRVSYAAAALITQGKKLKPGAPTPGFFMPSSVAPTAEPSAINVVPRKAAPKKVNFDTLQGMLDEKGNFVKPKSIANQLGVAKKEGGPPRLIHNRVMKPGGPAGIGAAPSGIDAATSAILDLISPTSTVPSASATNGGVAKGAGWVGAGALGATKNASASAAIAAAARATSAASRLLRPLAPANPTAGSR